MKEYNIKDIFISGVGTKSRTIFGFTFPTHKQKTPHGTYLHSSLNNLRNVYPIRFIIFQDNHGHTGTLIFTKVRNTEVELQKLTFNEVSNNFKPLNYT